uniref:Uncharacterized protein n=1 Tax=Salix viminalis TaxID=40686 RepID=A0A6N2N404_SALVM
MDIYSFEAFEVTEKKTHCNLYMMQSLKIACQTHPNIAVEKPRLWPIIRRSTLNRLLLLRIVFALSLVSSINGVLSNRTGIFGWAIWHTCRIASRKSPSPTPPPPSDELGIGPGGVRLYTFRNENVFHQEYELSTWRSMSSSFSTTTWESAY